jgi:acylphosphatase
MSTEKSVHVRIEGKVQRVWYRDWTVKQATALGLRGWVRNRLDSSVEAVFSGPAEIVDKMVEACKTGSPKSSVTSVKAEPCDPPTQTGFEQVATA